MLAGRWQRRCHENEGDSARSLAARLPSYLDRVLMGRWREERSFEERLACWTKQRRGCPAAQTSLRSRRKLDCGPGMTTESLRRTADRRVYPPFFARASSISFNSFGGDIGNDRGRTPMHWPIALAIAAMVGTTGTSPTPRKPYGWRGFGTSTISVPIIGTSDATG